MEPGRRSRRVAEPWAALRIRPWPRAKARSRSPFWRGLVAARNRLQRSVSRRRYPVRNSAAVVCTPHAFPEEPRIVRRRLVPHVNRHAPPEPCTIGQRNGCHSRSMVPTQLSIFMVSNPLVRNAPFFSAPSLDFHCNLRILVRSCPAYSSDGQTAARKRPQPVLRFQPGD